MHNLIEQAKGTVDQAELYWKRGHTISVEYENQRLQQIIDEQTDSWGIKVSLVEIKHVDLPAEMQRAIARQAEAERERRAKVIHADGEFQASQKLYEAANILGQNSMTLQLRFLQTLTEVASEKNSTMIFPLPIDLFEPFFRKARGDG